MVMFKERKLESVSNKERIESVKAGILSGGAFTLAYGVVLLVHHYTWTVTPEGFNLLFKVAIAFVSGFLFGVTYRYIVRTEQNSHLKDGAVLAFGLVRGLGTTEVSQFLSQDIWVLGIVGVESLLCFAVARFFLDLALQYHWVKPFS